MMTDKNNGMKGYGTVAVTRSHNKSTNIHVPAEVRDVLKLIGRERMKVELDVENKRIIYTLEVSR